jgi:16S rRNA processing protein RimM
VEQPQGRAQGKGVVARLDGVDDRDAATALVGTEIWVPRDALPKPRQGEYYWADLEGLAVRTVDGVDLGRVSHLFATGANDVMVVQGGRERLIPFVPGRQVVKVDLDAGLIEVDWDPDF